MISTVRANADIMNVRLELIAELHVCESEGLETSENQNNWRKTK